MAQILAGSFASHKPWKAHRGLPGWSHHEPPDSRTPVCNDLCHPGLPARSQSCAAFGYRTRLSQQLQAGLVAGDVLVTIDGKEFRSMEGFKASSLMAIWVSQSISPMNGMVLCKTAA